MKRNRRFLGNRSKDEDPLAGMANLTDAMLVLAVGFLIFAVMSMNMQSIIFTDSTAEEKKELAEKIKQTIAVESAEDYNGTAEINSGDNEGMEQMGTVYKDPKTGKLLMIPP